MADRWICVDASPCRHTGRPLPIQQGAEYVLTPCPHPRCTGGVLAAGVALRRNTCLSANRFRKVERKTDKQSLTEWLSQPAGDTDRIDRSAPIAPRKRERA